MEFIVDNWYIIVTAVIFVVGGIMAVVRWANLSSDKRYEQIRGWLLQAVIYAEREFGSGTGKLKLSSVYDRFCERFPWLAKILTFETFSKYVDDALGEMKEILKQNAAIASIIEPAEGGSNEKRGISYD